MPSIIPENVLQEFVLVHPSLPKKVRNSKQYLSFAKITGGSGKIRYMDCGCWGSRDKNKVDVKNKSGVSLLRASEFILARTVLILKEEYPR